MKTKFTIFALFATLFATQIQAQDMTTVRAKNSDISDNLDLKAVASIFGDSEDLADFERRLNDPKMQISNLDLNGDNQVDYLRVIETVENNTHLIIIQSVLEKDVFQDVATVEVERDSNNNVQVQVVGDVYMYGSNYIYEPVYVHSPAIYNVFWVNSYRPYYSPYYYSYYPSYYYGWSPYPVYRYQRNVHVHINVNNNYNYVNTRRSSRAVAMYNGRRSDGYARQYPDRSFAQRNTNATNRNDLITARNQNAGTRATSTRGTSNSVRSTTGTRNNTSTATSTRSESNAVRSTTGTRNNTTTPTRSESNSVRSTTGTRNNTSVSTPTRSNSSSTAPVRSSDNSTRTPSAPTQTAPVRMQTQTRAQAPAQAQTRTQSAPQQSQRSSGGESRGNAGGRR